MVKKFVQWLAVASKKIKDAYNPKSYTWRMVLVPKPTAEQPYPCILVTLSNGYSKVLFRLADLAAYHRAFDLTLEEEAKITEALGTANIEADKIEEDNRLIYQKRRMVKGAKWVDTATGEVVAEAESILHNTATQGEAHE